jgi:hypothetical protein
VRFVTVEPAAGLRVQTSLPAGLLPAGTFIAWDRAFRQSRLPPSTEDDRDVPDGCEDSAFAPRENRNPGPGPGARRRPSAQPLASARGQPRHWQDHNCLAVPAGRSGRGEVGIYVSLAETEHELREGARSHGWVIGPKIEIFELVSPESVLDPEQHQSLLYSSDLELGETIKGIFEAIERLKPKRVVIDSLSEIPCWRKARCATAGRSSRSSTISPVTTRR